MSISDIVKSTIGLDSTSSKRGRRGILDITGQVVDSSSEWNSEALTALRTEPSTVNATETRLLPANLIFAQDSAARRMSTDEWNKIALQNPPKAT
jgi:hypothetical protein